MPLVVLDPTEPLPTTTGFLNPRLDSLAGKTLGIIWNGRQPGPGDQILKGVAEELRKRYRVAEVIFRVKPYGGNATPDEVLDELASRSHAVLTGVGD